MPSGALDMQNVLKPDVDNIQADFTVREQIRNSVGLVLLLALLTNIGQYSLVMNIRR